MGEASQPLLPWAIPLQFHSFCLTLGQQVVFQKLELQESPLSPLRLPSGQTPDTSGNWAPDLSGEKSALYHWAILTTPTGSKLMLKKNIPKSFNKQWAGPWKSLPYIANQNYSNGYKVAAQTGLAQGKHRIDAVEYYEIISDDDNGEAIAMLEEHLALKTFELEKEVMPNIRKPHLAPPLSLKSRLSPNLPSCQKLSTCFHSAGNWRPIWWEWDE